jgi:acetyl esterase/lipase
VASFPAPMLDSTRAIQFLRSKAKEWNLDPTRVAACGGSAGAGISMWIAFRDDMAKPGSADPVERQSTRLSCIGPYNGQCSYDPRWIKKHIGGSDISHSALPPFYGLAPEEYNTPKAYKLFDEAAAINYLTKDDPPVFMFYPGKMTDLPLPADAPEGLVIHHPQFGVVLKAEMEKLGIKCELHLAEEYEAESRRLQEKAFGQMVQFFAACFGGR